MKVSKSVLFVVFPLVQTFESCNVKKINKASYAGSANTSGYRVQPLPAPYSTGSAKNFSKVEGWKDNNTPVAPNGFTVTKFAEDLDHPRWIYAAENGDIFVAESNTVLKGISKIGAGLSRKISTQHIGRSANKVILFRDFDKNGIPARRYVFLENLNQPFGMLIIGHKFYVANTDALMEYDYKPGDTSILEKGLANEVRRADILEVNADGSGEHIYASGLRNPAGMAWAPGTKTLWTAVNERDALGDELVPDYLTSVRENGFYGWPFSYYGQHEDPRMKKDRL
jgi:glucose/arabinose dehydrogenase